MYSAGCTCPACRAANTAARRARRDQRPAAYFQSRLARARETGAHPGSNELNRALAELV